MNEKISCTYIGHASTLLRLGEANILTDPHLGKRVLGAKRQEELGLHPKDLPHLSCILLSHTHADHLDISSYKYISCGVPIFVPEGYERAVGRYLPNPVIELSHFACHELACGTEITAVPVVHPQNHLFDFSKTHSNAYLVRTPGGGTTIYFCGDSAYGQHFRETGNLGHIDLALVPIGSYAPAWLMKGKHMTPAEAVNAFEDLRADHMVPIHHGTFRLSLERPGAPLEWLSRILHERPDLAKRIHPLFSGQTFEPCVNEGANVTSIHVA
jgi:L-ascorbate metabolism protein UlaG (beta-lactamase superfamily)